MTALYIHIPFCKRKCNYCDFVSSAGKEELIDKYVNALANEISQLPTPDSLSTIYFGGGTPTLLEPKHFNQIISTLIRHSSFDIRHCEVSIEANPGTADLAKLQALRKLGLNRLSIGVQSFNDRHLKTLGRIHDAATAKHFYVDARKAGFTNLNLDLMFALPDQTLAEWQKDLDTAIELGPEHLSIYNLQIEEGTPLSLHLSHYTLPAQEVDLAMFEYAIDKLTTAGYHHYEISNFAKPGFECQHNINYWKNGNYLGVGAGAHSHVNGSRWANTNSIEEYINHPQPRTIDPSSHSTDRQETIFLGLRLLDGLPIENFTGFEKEVAELIKDGLLEKSGNDYKLTRQGLYLGNLVFERFV